MSVERLAHPEWLQVLLATVAGVGVLLVFAGRRARRRRQRLLGHGTRTPRTHLASDAALWLALAAIALALLGPRVGERTLEIPASGVDVVLLVDVSRSMDASDVPPSRLDRARRAAQGLLERLAPFDRAALAAFAGRGVLLTPLTPDRGALSELMTGLDTQLLAQRSSHLGEGLRAALEAFEAGSERPRLVVVLSDGEDPDRHRELGAADAARREARVLTLLVGTEVGSTLPDHGVPLRDRFGSVVVSRRDRARADALAETTGGEVFLSDEWGGFALDDVVASLRRDAGSAPGAVVRRRVRAVRVAPLAALAFGLLLVEGLPRPRRTRLRVAHPRPRRVQLRVARPRALLRRASVATALAAALLLDGSGAPAQVESTLDSLEAEVRRRPDDSALLVDLGAARLERGKREAAARAFLAAALAARSPHAAAVGYYDLGIAHLERGDLEAARDAFFEALAFAPDDRKARYNLEWTLLGLARQPSTPPELPPPAREESPPPPDSAQRAAADSEEPEAPPPPPPSEAQQRRWLERVVDDPARSLRAIADAHDDSGAARARSGAPAW